MDDDDRCRRQGCYRAYAATACAVRVVDHADRAAMDRPQWPPQHGLLQRDVRPRDRRDVAAARHGPGLCQGTPGLELYRRMPCAVPARDTPRRSRADLDPATGRRRKTVAYVRGIAPRYRGLALRHLGKHDHPYRHEGPKNRAVSARHSRPGAGGDECPCGRVAPRGHRPESDDALEIARDRRQTCVRPRTNPTTAETRNRITAMKKIALAISTEAPAIPPKPRTPAISATTRNVTTQLSTTPPLLPVSLSMLRPSRRTSAAETIQAGNEGSGRRNPEI